MNKLIKNAIVYNAKLPDADALRQHFEASRFTEPTQLQWHSAGFVEIPATGELVSTFEGGLAFAVRYDSKILPASVIRAEVEKRLDAIEKQEGRRPSKETRQSVRDMVTDELLAKALTKTAIVTAYYDPAKQYLIVPVSSKQLADVVISQLVHAVKSMKTTTINISDVKLGLTTKVREWLADAESDTFGWNLEPGGRVKMVSETESASFDMTALDKARAGIEDALGNDFKVSELGMIFQGRTSFRLTHEFRFKGFSFGYEPTEADDAREAWEFDASLQLLELGTLVDSMCDLLGYKAEEKQEAAE